MERLGIALGDGPECFTRPFLVDIHQAATLRRWRAACYASAALPDTPDGKRPRPRSRAFLCELAGRTSPTLRTWERLQRVRLAKNHGIYRRGLTRTAAEFMAAEAGPMYFTISKADGWAVALSMPNSYEKLLPTSYTASGRSKKLRRKHRALSQTRAADVRPLYFYDPRRVAGRPANFDRYLFGRELYDGRVAEWDIVEAAT